eukprot:TRINITY_DN60300_c0_g1_i1.p2 TRINITY_DN60300_c0_g1~~TRINITY_DN60300_c0_g1_i1.p2  ORF type:complete len:462 (+),score=151.72 TRINITY_DN60300_c0_g1_i1:68-1387(+)
MTVFSGGGLAGKPAAGWFGVPPGWVDLSRPPGATSQERSGFGAAEWWVGYLRMAVLFIFTPNVVWLLMAALAYVLVPYDYEAAARWCPGFALKRAAANCGMTWAYYGYFHWAIYAQRRARRKFDQSCDGPTLARLLHNVWYTTLGALQWTGWELAFVHLYGSGRLGYTPDGEAFGTPAGLAQTAALALLVPVWREVHFYVAHRMLHFRALYRYVHSLHHRNSDPEPFSGLAMHPVEHLYYFSCMAVPLYVTCSPFVMLWIGLHAAISPACPHSGFEDHWHCDQFHYVHHARFDCNFGIPAIPFDKWFGTYREACYQEPPPGGPRHTYLQGGLSPSWALWGTWDQAVFDITIGAVLAAVAGAAVAGGVAAQRAAALAGALALGPIAVALALGVASGDRESWRWPFLRERVLGACGAHLAAGAAICILPVYHTAAALVGLP